ncbi:MAG: glycosyltransferase family 4 protein [Acidobacteriaceae bacterium]
MRILLIVDSYLPEPKATGPMFRSLAAELTGRGHQVTILTLSAALTQRSHLDQTPVATVLRVRAPKLKGTNLVLRGLNELRLSGLVKRRAGTALSDLRADLIAFYSPTIFWAPLVRRLKRKWSARAVLILRDIFPQWALDAGQIRRGPHFSVLQHYADLQYAVAERIGIQSPGNRAYFAEHRPQYLPKLGVLFNWVDAAAVAPPRADIRTRLNFAPAMPIFLYGGNLGVAQDPDLLLHLASTVEGKAHVLVVGEGLAFDRVRDAAKRHINLTVWPSTSQEDFLSIAQESSVGLVLLNGNLTTHNVPGKILTYVQAGLPILASVNRGNDLKCLLESSGAGACTWADEQAEFLSNAVRICDPLLRQDLAANVSDRLRPIFSVAAAADFILATD